jgi:ATP-dependent Clp protease ATP-binding subunit ClpA
MCKELHERFTDCARKVMQLANEEAHRFRHKYIGTEHILLGLIGDDSAFGANVLKNVGVDLQAIHREVERLIQSGRSRAQAERLPQTPQAKAVMQSAIQEAHNLNHQYVGSEHILLGLLREPDTVAAQVLTNMGLTLEGVRGEILNLLRGGQTTILPFPPFAGVPGRDPRIKLLFEGIKALDQEKKKAVEREDYERATVLRDRLKELQSQLQQLLGSVTPKEKDDRESGGEKDA